MTATSRTAADHSKLHLTKLEAFATWAASVGYTCLPVKGEYEVLRLQHGEGSPLIWFRRDSGEHATSAVREARLVRRWFGARYRDARAEHVIARDA